MFWAFSRPSSGAQWLHWQPLVLPSYRVDSHAVFVVGPVKEHILNQFIVEIDQNLVDFLKLKIESITTWSF
jgi:hypothetical protein